jgi:hypothetical protein
LTPILVENAGAKRDRILYNLLPGDRALIRAWQDDTDPITGEPLSAAANLDHDHKTGLIRGLLNPLTNKFLIDDIERLYRSIEYLKNPPAPQALGAPVYGILGKAKLDKKKKLYGPTGTLEPHARI